MSAYATLATIHPLPDRPVADRPLPNQPVANRTLPHRPLPHQPLPDRPVTDRPVGNRQLPDQFLAERPLPDHEPPPMDGALALRYDVEPEPDLLPAPPVLRLVPIPAGPRLPDAQAWASKLVQAVAEVLAGDRPISQLVRFTDSTVFGELNRRVRLLGLTTTATARGRKERSAVRSVHVFTPATEVAEVAAHVRYGERSRAIALRLEVHRGRWICTALELG